MSGMTEEGTTALWEDYKKSIQHQNAEGVRSRMPQCVRFFEGDQWPRPTADTANFPRPVVNVAAMIARNKIAAVLSSPIRILYRADEMESARGEELMKSGVSAETFTRFSDYIQKELGQSALDKRAVHDGAVKGCYAYHYYWDAEADGKDAVTPGALRCEVIDPMNVHFANPTQHDEQKQEWIIISSRENVDAVRALIKDPEARARIDATDDRENAYKAKEPETGRLCTVLTRYFRRDGEVYFERGTENAIITPPTPLRPDIEAAKRALGIPEDDATEPVAVDGGGMDAPNATMPDGGEQLREQKKQARATLYPVVVASWERRESSVYGIGEVERAIPNQKVINNLLAMIVYNVQQMAWPKWVVLPDALKGQVITNEPGETLVDKSKTGKGIQQVPPAAMPQTPMELLDQIINLTRNVSGASEVMTGETLGANMSGAAIAQLQAQAQQPIEALCDAFWEVKRRQGRVLAQFFKLFYHGRTFVWEESGDGAERHLGVARFEGDDYADFDFDVVIEVMGSTKYSAAGDINVLDSLLASGKISLKTYIESYPDDAMSNKSKILEGIRRDEQEQQAALQQQIEQLTAQLQQAVGVIAQQREIADNAVTIMNENKRLKVALQQQYVETEALRTEAVEKINAANAQIEAGNAKIREVTADASEFAQVIASVQGG